MSLLDPQWIKRRNPVLRRLESNSVYTFLREYRSWLMEFKYYGEITISKVLFLGTYLFMMNSRGFGSYYMILGFLSFSLVLLLVLSRADRKSMGRGGVAKEFNVRRWSEVLHDPKSSKDVLLDLWESGCHGGELYDSYLREQFSNYWSLDLLVSILIVGGLGYQLVYTTHDAHFSLMLLAVALLIFSGSISWYLKRAGFYYSSQDHVVLLTSWSDGDDSLLVGGLLGLSMSFAQALLFLQSMLIPFALAIMVFLPFYFMIYEAFESIQSRWIMLWVASMMYLFYTTLKLMNFRKNYLAGYRAYLKDRREFVRHFDVYIRKNLVEDPDWERTP